MSKAVKEMRLVCRQLLHLCFCARGLTFGAGEKKSNERAKKFTGKVYGELCQEPEPKT